MLPSIMVVTLKFLISSEKSLQVRLDYCAIINHIQRHEKHILFTHLRAPKKTRRTREECAAPWLRWAAHLHNIWFERASGEWFCFRSGAEMNGGNALRSFCAQIKIPIGAFYFIWYVSYRQSHSFDRLCSYCELNSCQQLWFLSDWMNMLQLFGIKAGKVKLLHHTSHRRPICRVKSN